MNRPISTCDRMQHLVLIVVAAVLLLPGCAKTDNCFTEQVCRYDANSVEVVPLHGECVLDSLIAYNLNLVAVGDYLCLTTPRLDTLFHVYSLHGDLLASFGLIGQGPNDFANTQIKGQVGQGATGCYIWVNDVSSAALKRVNLTESVRAHTCKVDMIVKTYPMSVNAFYVNDSVVVQEVMSDSNYKLFTCKNGQAVSQETLYKEDVQTPFSVYKSEMRLDPSSDLLVMAMNSMNQVNFLHLKTGERLAACVGEQTDMEEVVDKDTQLEKWTYYVDVELTRSHVYAMYMNQDYSSSFSEEKEIDIHVFDKDGRLEKILRLDHYLWGFWIDDAETMLYAYNDSSVYRYRL